MKKKVILLLLITVLITLTCSCSYYFDNISNTIERARYKNDIIVSPNTTPSFIALRFEDVIKKNNIDTSRITPEKLEQILKYLTKNKYTFLTSKDVYEAIINKNYINPNSIWLTFDGGLETNHTKVTALLKKYKAHATAFIPISFINQPHRLTNLHIKEMVKSQVWDIQTQGIAGNLDIVIDNEKNKGSFYLNKLWVLGNTEDLRQYSLRITKDLKDSIQYIKNNFNQDTYFFAYPFYLNINEHGDYQLVKSLKACISQLGLLAVSNYESGFMTISLDIDKYNIPRYNIYDYSDPETIFSPTYTARKLKFDDNTFAQFNNIDYNSLTIFNTNSYASTNKNLDIVSNCVYMPKKLLKGGYEILNIQNDTIYLQKHYNSEYHLSICDLNFNIINTLLLSRKAVGVFNIENDTYMLDSNNSIYKIGSELEKIHDTNLLCKSSSICFYDRYLYIVDNTQKWLYIYDFYNKKLIDTKKYNNYDLSLCCYTDYGLIAYEKNYDVFVNLIFIDEY